MNSVNVFESNRLSNTWIEKKIHFRHFLSLKFEFLKVLDPHYF
jgi:hypothetical protein